MDTETFILRLQLITLFDSISFGLIYAFLAPYLMVLGGDNVTTGMLAVLTLMCQLISPNVVKKFIRIHGKRDALFTMFSIAVISHVLLALTGSYWFTIFARCLFSLTNQPHDIIKELLIKKAPENELHYHQTVNNICSSSGYLIGPVVTGCLFNIGFSLSCTLAAILTLFCAGIVVTMPMARDEVPSEGSDRSLIEETIEQATKTTILFKKSNYEKNWDLITLKFLFVSSMTIFFCKFPQILIYNYKADPSVVGYTTSYLNAVTFIATYLAVKFKDKYDHIPILLLTHQALLVTFFSMLVACYAPFYFLFGLACIPLIFAKNYISTVWEKLYSERKNDSLTALNDSTGIAAGLTVPIAFGVVCNIIKHHAVVLFSVVPIILALYILNTYTCKIEVEEEQSDRTKDD